MTTLLESLTHKPEQLRFGTSGLRGLVTDMTDLECYINTRGFLDFLTEQTVASPGENVYIGMDLRDSSPRIAAAVAQATTDAGYTPRFCGLVPTPALAYYALCKRAACIMVSGSHIPSDRNGIKFYRPTGEVAKSDEADIFTAVAMVREQLYGTDITDSLLGADAQLKEPPELDPQPLQDEVIRNYTDRYTGFFPGKPLEGKTIVVYQHSSVARDLLAAVLEELGATAIPVGRSTTFVPIDTENVTPKDQAYFTQLAREYPGAFAIVSMDGDADRPFIIDKHGTFHRGDAVGALTATYLGAKHAAFPVSTSDAVISYLREQGITCTLTKIGSPYVVAAMEKQRGKGSVSWEVNGGFLTIDPFHHGGGLLQPLPTRDAMLPILAVLTQATVHDQSVAELFGTLPARATAAGLLDEVPATRTEALIGFLRTAAGKARLAELGIGTIKEVNNLDGERITFTSGDIVHLRQSGNAPQLRIYSVADSQKRADELVQGAIAPKGWLQQLLREH